MVTSVFECDKGFSKSDLTKSTNRCLILASYCDKKSCTDEFPCPDCLQMCNVADVDLYNTNILGDFGILKSKR